MFGVRSRSSTVELHLYDWNRFASNKMLGKVTLDLRNLQEGQLNEEWRALDTQGELRVRIHFCPAICAKAATMGMRLPNLRLQLENAVYYPGQTVRGALIYAVQKRKKVQAVRLIAEGYSNAEWTTRAGKPRMRWIGCANMFNSSVTFLGSAQNEPETFTLESGGYIYPFEFVLPTWIPHTYESGGEHCVRYSVFGFCDVAGAERETTSMTFRVLAIPQNIRPEPSLVLPPNVKQSDIQVSVSGASTMYSGESYELNCHIVNKSSKVVESLQVRLKTAMWLSAKGNYWARSEGFWGLVRGGVWNCSALPGLPVQPGQEWHGTLQVSIPPDQVPSLHSSVSPIIQKSYRIGVKVTTSGGVFAKASGTTRYLVLMNDRYTNFAPLTAPSEAEGKVGEVISAPAPPTIHSSLIPAPSADGKTVVGVGKPFGRIADYPNASAPVQISRISCFGAGKSAYHYPKPEVWQPGSIPEWIKTAEERALGANNATVVDSKTPETETPTPS